jgi:hypothetical protein
MTKVGEEHYYAEGTAKVPFNDALKSCRDQLGQETLLAPVDTQENHDNLLSILGKDNIFEDHFHDKQGSKKTLPPFQILTLGSIYTTRRSWKSTRAPELKRPPTIFTSRTCATLK